MDLYIPTHAELVFDQESDVIIPSVMDAPRADQMQGTWAERLAEVCGRICYDSMGTESSRPSFDVGEKEGYHTHIIKSGHGSVLEHFQFTVEVELNNSNRRGGELLSKLINRRGVFVDHSHAGYAVTLNMRSALEWRKGCQLALVQGLDETDDAILAWANKLAPHIVPNKNHEPQDYIFCKQVPARTPHQKWVSLYMRGSRGWSHEQVRHGDWTAISQRSTRFVDESGSPWVQHPLTRQFFEEFKDDEIVRSIEEDTHQTVKWCRGVYDKLVPRMQTWLKKRGVDNTTARKQARGAARGYLGNALTTEMIFSASVYEWWEIIKQRGGPGADAEIRELTVKALPELQRSAHGASFQNYRVEPSPDGIGEIIVAV